LSPFFLGGFKNNHRIERAMGYSRARVFLDDDGLTPPDSESAAPATSAVN
jgi:hypothetical protein